MYAFDHMRQAGAYLTTFESIVLQLTQDASHPKFKQIQQLIKTSAADTGLTSWCQPPTSSLWTKSFFLLLSIYRINTRTRATDLERCSDIFNMGWDCWHVWALDSVFSVLKLRKIEVFSHPTDWTYGMRWSIQRVLFRDHDYDGEKRREDID